MKKPTMKQLQYRNVFQPLNNQCTSWFSYLNTGKSVQEAKLQVIKNKVKKK